MPDVRGSPDHHHVDRLRGVLRAPRADESGGPGGRLIPPAVESGSADATLASRGARGSLLLLRHGETAWTAARRVVGRRPVGLSERGRAQSRAMIPMLRELAPGRVVTSPLARASETAAIIAAGLGCPLVVDADLQELDFGDWEGRGYDELVEDARYQAFSRRPLEVTPPGGEAVLTAQRRVVGALTRALAATPGARVCVVGHGDAFRLALAAFLGVPTSEFRRLRLDTCGLSAVELTGEWAELKFVNVLSDPGRVWSPLHWRPAPDGPAR